MAYQIKHQSPDECLIRYVKDHGPRITKRFYISLAGFSFVALMIDVPFILILLGLFFVIFVLRKSHPSRAAFEVHLYRIQNSIEFRKRNQSFTTDSLYPLDLFKGFGYSEIPPLPNTDGPPKVELFYKFDEAFSESGAATIYTLVSETGPNAETNGGPFWKVPIRHSEDPVTPENAKQILSATNEWLRRAKEKSRLEETVAKEKPLQEIAADKEILRDFRDVE